MTEESQNFHNKLLASLCHGLHSMCTEKVLCDLEVSVGGKTFDCHLLLLASVSGFFRSLVSGSWQENNSGKVTLDHEDVTQDSFQMFLDILYKSEDVITMDTAADLLRLAIFLQVKFLEEYCAEYLTKHLTPEVCVGIWMLGEKYQQPHLAHTASTMAAEEIHMVVQGNEILQLPKSMLLILLGSQKALSMDDICRTVLRWVEEDADARQTYFEELLLFISFPQLSPGYIRELMNYFQHPFFKHISKGIQEAVSFNLPDQPAELKQQILAKQERISKSPLLQTCAVSLGGGGESDDSATNATLTAFGVEPGTKFYTFPLKNPPEPFAPQFTATCVYRNELYISQRDKQKTLLAKYVTGNNEWEILPPLERGVERHSMAAVRDRVYLIGGSTQNQQRSIPYFNLITKTWSETHSGLLVDAEDTATAVLGHRIYVFGGKDASQKSLDIVQCLDTRSGQVYKAGALSSPAGDILAVSDGGTIYILCDGARVLKMKEHFELAERKEKTLLVKVNDGQAQPMAASENSGSVPSVVFLDVGTFTDGGKVLSAFLHQGEMVGCGTVSEDGAITSKVQVLSLATGQVVNKRLAFNNAQKNTVLRTLNIPQEFLNEDTAVAHFQQGDRIKWKGSCPLPAEIYIGNQYVSYGYRQGYANVSYDQIGTIASIPSHGTVTTTFPYYQNQNFSADSLCFAD